MPSSVKPLQLRRSSALVAVVLLTVGITACVKAGMGCGLASEYDVVTLSSFCGIGSLASAMEAKREKVRK